MTRAQANPALPPRTVWRAVLLVAALTGFGAGCSCGPTPVSTDGGALDAGPFFGGIDAPGYEPRDGGLRPPEPCAVPVRRVRFPLGDASLGDADRLWAHGSHVWVYLGGYPGGGAPPPSLHLFDLEAERELDIDFVLADNERVSGVFQVATGYEIVVRSGDDGTHRVVHVGADGRDDGTDDEPLGLDAPWLIRLDDGRYVAALADDRSPSPEPAYLELASPSGTVERLDLGFETERAHLMALHWTGDTLVGIGYEEEAARVVRFEVDLETGAVRIGTLTEGVRISGVSGPGGVFAMLSSTGDVVTAAIVHERTDEPSGSTAELFWWSIGGESVTRYVVRPASDLPVGVFGLAGQMPRQTLVLAQISGGTAWVTAARIRGLADVVGGMEPIGVFTGVGEAAAWQPSEGTAGLALISQHELEALYFCEGVP